MVSKTLWGWSWEYYYYPICEGGDTLATDITDSNGRYEFCNLDMVTTLLELMHLLGYTITSKNQGDNDS